MRKWFSPCLMILLFLIFLIYKNEVVTGAAEGLLLWYRFVLPSLLPFMILVNVMIHTDTISLLANLTGPLMKYVPGVFFRGSFRFPVRLSYGGEGICRFGDGKSDFLCRRLLSVVFLQ